MEVLKPFFIAFIPLFVAFNAIAVVPLFLSVSDDMTTSQRKKLISQATLTALTVSLLFVVAGQFIFRFLGITDNDFRIGGGIVLLVLSVSDLLFSQNFDKRRKPNTDEIGVVPVGIPMMVGPAVLTTIILLADTVGYFWTLSALLVNLLLVFLIFRQARLVVKVVGKSGTKAFSKLASLFLCAIAVKMIRVGIVGIFG